MAAFTKAKADVKAAHADYKLMTGRSHPLEDQPRSPDGRRDKTETLHLVFRVLEPRRWSVVRMLLVSQQGYGSEDPGLCPDGRDAA